MSAGRFLPEVTITCRVCGAPITIRNRFEPGQGIVSEPLECPTCSARIKNAPAIELGIARSLVLLATGARVEKKEYGTVERFLDRFTLRDSDVDALLALADSIDKPAKVAALIRKGADTVKAAYREERERCLRIAAERRR